MSLATFFWALLLIELTFAGVDLAERHGSRHQRYAGERLRAEGLAFLIMIGLLFTAIQYAALALAPRLDQVADALRGQFASRVIEPVEPPTVLGMTVMAIALFYLAGFWDYLFHRYASHSRWLWFTHENHHLPNQVFVGMPGLFSRPFVVTSVLPVVGITVITSYLLALLAGFPLWDWSFFQIPLLAASVVLTASHSSYLRQHWGLHRVMRAVALTSPQEHVLHHTVDLHGNYGNFTTLWDRIFGTYLDPLRAENRGHACGLPYDQDFIGTLTLGRLKLSQRLRDRFQVHRYCNISRSTDTQLADRS